MKLNFTIIPFFDPTNETDGTLDADDPRRHGHRVMAMRLHGVFMIIAWFIFVPIAITVARYFRSTLSMHTLGLATWFQVHRTLAMVGIGFVVAGTISILIHTDWSWSCTGQDTFAHGVVGVITIFGAFIQPFVALFRCNPTHKLRYIFAWFHRLFGLSVLGLAQLAILLTTFMAEPGLTPNGIFGYGPRITVTLYWAFSVVMILLLELARENSWLKLKFKEHPVKDDGSSLGDKGKAMQIILLILFISSSILFGGILVFSILYSKVVEG